MITKSISINPVNTRSLCIGFGISYIQWIHRTPGCTETSISEEFKSRKQRISQNSFKLRISLIIKFREFRSFPGLDIYMDGKLIEFGTVSNWSVCRVLFLLQEFKWRSSCIFSREKWSANSLSLT